MFVQSASLRIVFFNKETKIKKFEYSEKPKKKIRNGKSKSGKVETNFETETVKQSKLSVLFIKVILFQNFSLKCRFRLFRFEVFPNNRNFVIHSTFHLFFTTPEMVNSWVRCGN